MGNKELSQDNTKKAIGFYVTIFTAVLSIATAIIYGVQFSAISYKEPVFNQNICIFVGVMSCLALILLFVSKLRNFAPVLLCVGSGISMLMYVKMVIWPISDTIYGIEPFPQINTVILCAILFGLSFVFAEVSLYMKKSK